MPKTDMIYANTIIYKLVCKDLDIKDCYVGHTTNFIKRKSLHKRCCNNSNSKNYNFKVYCFIRDNNGWDNWSMIEIEKYPCNDRNEAVKRERFWYEELKANLNMCYPTRTKKEWKEDNKEILKVKSKEYKEKHLEIIKVKNKEYKEKNKEIIKEKNKEYREKNKEIIKATPKERHSTEYKCVCGSTITQGCKSRHNKSLKHKQYIESLDV